MKNHKTIRKQQKTKFIFMFYSQLCCSGYLIDMHIKYKTDYD